MDPESHGLIHRKFCNNRDTDQLMKLVLDNHDFFEFTYEFVIIMNSDLSLEYGF